MSSLGWVILVPRGAYLSPIAVKGVGTSPMQTPAWQHSRVRQEDCCPLTRRWLSPGEYVRISSETLLLLSSFLLILQGKKLQLASPHSNWFWKETMTFTHSDEFLHPFGKMSCMETCPLQGHAGGSKEHHRQPGEVEGRKNYLEWNEAWEKQELMVHTQKETSEGWSSNPMCDLDLLCDLGQVVSPVQPSKTTGYWFPVGTLQRH